MNASASPVFELAQWLALVPCIVSAVMSWLTLRQTRRLAEWTQENERKKRRSISFLDAKTALSEILPNSKQVEFFINNMKRYDESLRISDSVVFNEFNGHVSCEDGAARYCSLADLRAVETCASDNMELLGDHVSRFSHLYTPQFYSEIAQLVHSWNADSKKMGDGGNRIEKDAEDPRWADWPDGSELWRLDYDHLIKPIQIRYRILRYYESELRPALGTGQ